MRGFGPVHNEMYEESLTRLYGCDSTEDRARWRAMTTWQHAVRSYMAANPEEAGTFYGQG